jgi:hypothetical protein
LENEGRIAETIVHSYGPSVCLLHVVVEFRDKDSGQLIRIAADATGKPRVDNKGMVSLDTDGMGPPLQLDFFGTGFLVASDGRLLTNHHVAEPWWGDKELKQILDVGAAAFVVSLRRTSPEPLKVSRPSSTGFRRRPIWQLSSYRLQRRLRPHSWSWMIGVKPV